MQFGVGGIHTRYGTGRRVSIKNACITILAKFAVMRFLENIISMQGYEFYYSFHLIYGQLVDLLCLVFENINLNEHIHSIP